MSCQVFYVLSFWQISDDDDDECRRIESEYHNFCHITNFSVAVVIRHCLYKLI